MSSSAPSLPQEPEASLLCPESGAPCERPDWCNRNYCANGALLATPPQGTEATAQPAEPVIDDCWFATVDALVDIWEDSRQFPPGEGTYVSGALSNMMAEAKKQLDTYRARIEAQRASLPEATAQAPAELPGMWDESDLSGGETDCARAPADPWEARERIDAAFSPQALAAQAPALSEREKP